MCYTNIIYTSPQVFFLFYTLNYMSTVLDIDTPIFTGTESEGVQRILIATEYFPTLLRFRATLRSNISGICMTKMDHSPLSILPCSMVIICSSFVTHEQILQLLQPVNPKNRAVDIIFLSSVE